MREGENTVRLGYTKASEDECEAQQQADTLGRDQWSVTLRLLSTCHEAPLLPGFLQCALCTPTLPTQDAQGPLARKNLGTWGVAQMVKCLPDPHTKSGWGHESGGPLCLSGQSG